MSMMDLLTVVNSDPKNTLNHMLWLNDYKTYGENSYVFQNKDILHELYNNYSICMNDQSIATECLNYAIEKNQAGNAIRNIFGLDESLQWDSVHCMEDIVLNENIFSNIFSNQRALKLLFVNFTQNKAIMDAICNSKDCLSVLYDYYLDFEDDFANSPYLLSACSSSQLYSVISNNTAIACSNESARRTHYGNKCFIVGMSQDIFSYTGYWSKVDTLNSVESSTCNLTRGTTGLNWRINKFASSAKCHPSIYANNTSSLTGMSYMAILKIA